MDKIDLSKYFDKVYILTYSGTDYSVKLNRLREQWTQLFVNDFDSKFVDIKYSFNSPLFRDLYDYYQKINPVLHDLDEHCLNVTIWHYLIIKEAYEMKYEHILVMEDDICFLKNLEKVRKVLDNIPANYGVCQLHKGYLLQKIFDVDKAMEAFNHIEHNGYFYKHTNNVVVQEANMVPCSSAMNCYSQEGMKAFLDIFENWKKLKVDGLLCDTFYVLLNCPYYVTLDDLGICTNEVGTDYSSTLINRSKEVDYFKY